MNKLILLVFLGSALTGCAGSQMFADSAANNTNSESTIPSDTPPKMQVVNIMSAESPQMSTQQNNLANGVDRFGAPASNTQYGSGQSGYSGKLMTKHIGDYVQNMTQDLVSNMEYLTDKTPVGVTNFALIDSNLQSTNILGYQLSESFMHELHKFRIPVIDFKATDYIRVTEQGDFLLTRDFLELSANAPIEYILTGTMTKHQSGYLINARIVGLKSKAIVASAQMLLPFYVADALLPSEQNSVDGVTLTQGE